MVPQRLCPAMLLSSKLNVSLLTVLLRHHGIRRIVLCPGSRNAPLVSNFCTDPFFECYQLSDERAAAFFALGMALHSAAPCAVCCTSGSALLNMHPAVWEAAAQRVPLLIISADRSKAWIDQKDGQTLEQRGVFGRLVKHEAELPQVLGADDAENRWFCERLINEAVCEVLQPPLGPVHINVPISDPLFEYADYEPEVRTFGVAGMSEALQVIARGRRRLLIIGQRRELLQLSPAVRDGLERNFIVFCEHLSNVRGLRDGSALEQLLAAAPPDPGELAPDVVAVMGGHIIGKQLKRFLRSVRCTHIEFGTDFADTFQNLRCLVRRPPEDAELLSRLAAIDPPADQDFMRRIRARMQVLRPPQDLPYSPLLITQQVMAALRPGECLHLANSSTVRSAQYFGLDPGVQVLCNRGVNGIDGSLSTAAGFAARSGCDNYVLAGDLSFFYDINALWQPQLAGRLRIVLINNAGGGIFAAIGGFRVAPRARHYVIADHATRARQLCRCHGLEYFAAEDAEGLQRGLQQLRSCRRDAVLECITDMQRDLDCLHSFLQQLRGPASARPDTQAGP